MKFKFTTPETTTSCNLKCNRCIAIASNGEQCKNRVCIGLRKCWAHRQKDGLKIKPSNIPNAGKGLFAVQKPGKDNNTPVFKKDQVIAPYEGDVRTTEQMDEMYGDYTAPYALQVGQGENAVIVDAACKRGIASLANHKPWANTNAKLTSKGNLTARKNIYNGQEIFVSYGHEYRFDEPTTYSTK